MKIDHATDLSNPAFNLPKSIIIPMHLNNNNNYYYFLMI